MLVKEQKVNKQPIQLASQIAGISTRVDGSLSIRVSTQELTAQETLQLLQYRGAVGWFMFKENQFDESEVPKEDANFEGKSPSIRLRGVIYRYWEQEKKEQYPDFEQFYRSQMEGIITQFKEKLDT